MATEKAVRFIREHLQDAIAAEKAFETQFRALSDDANNDQLRHILAQAAESARRDQERLARRLTELGGEISGIKSLVAQMAGTFPKFAELGSDPADRAVQSAIIAYAAGNCKIAMYETLAAVSDAAGDEDTATLARTIQEEPLAAAENIWVLIAPASEAAFRKRSGMEQFIA